MAGLVSWEGMKGQSLLRNCFSILKDIPSLAPISEQLSQAKFHFLRTQALVISVNFLQHQNAGEGFMVIVSSGPPMQQVDRFVLGIEKIGGRGGGGSVCGIGGSVVEFSPATRETRVRFPANATD